MKGPVLIVVVIVAMVGAVGGLALTGIINIPGITPAKKVDWKADLLRIYKDKKGTLKGDVVTLKGAKKEDIDAFVAAAKAGGLEPTAKDDGVKSAKLVELLKKEGGASVPVKVATKDKPKADPGGKDTKKVVPPVKPIVKPENGVQTIADLWNTIEIPKLIKVVATYKDPELATILLKMDQDHVSELLSQLPDPRSASLSREIQKQGAIIPAPALPGA